ncbi:MAG TPA: serine hydrolase domain-containing protein [Candidatus Acidoferrales bacterium]|nr:serine hydrolase domain-containing protein [Candidatus Acidoferrales bacterium]
MRWKLRRNCFRPVVVVMLCVLAFSQFACAAQNPSAKQIEAIFSGITSAKQPGLAVVVRKDGRTVFLRGYGSRDLRSGSPIDEHTNFRLASFTKQFTAMAIMLLVHDGKLRYDTRLTDVFPEFPAYGRAITIRNLLNHTCGLMAYEDLMDKKYAGKSWEEIPQISDAGVLALMEQQTGTKFPPGTKWEYSNGGYCVLAMVVEKLSGMPFADFLRRRIFEPLKMENTVAHEYGKNQVANRAYGYTDDAGVWLETDQSPTSATLGDGGIYSSLDDLIKWDDAIRNHTLLSAEEMRPAVTPENSAAVLPENVDDLPKTAGKKPLAYGFGWFLDPYRGHARMWHYGSSIGFHTIIQRFPADNLTIIILSNRSDLDLSAVSLKVADLYLPPDSYPNSSEGLQEFLNGAVASAKSGDTEKLIGMLKSTEIPDCVRGFMRHSCGEESSSSMALHAKAGEWPAR